MPIYMSDGIFHMGLSMSRGKKFRHIQQRDIIVFVEREREDVIMLTEIT